MTAELETSLTTEEGLELYLSDMADNGSLFLASKKDKQLVVERYTKGSKTSTRLVTDDKYKSSYRDDVLLTIDPKNNDRVLAVINYEEGMKYALFNFDKKTVAVKEESLNKDVAAQLLAQAENLPDFEKRSKMKEIEFLEATYAKFYNNGIVVVKELQYPGEARHVHFETIVAVYDDALNLKKNFIISKSFSSETGGYGDSYHINGDNFYVLTNNRKGTSLQPVFANINLKDLKWNKLTLLKEKDGKVLNGMVFAENTVWLPIGLLLDRRDALHLRGTSHEARLQLISYE